jgi:hypothetical protein
LAISDKKNYSAEDRIDGTIGLFQRNSGCSAEQKTPFPTVPQRRRMLGILYHGKKIEANSRNSILNHSAEQKTLGIPIRTVLQRRKCSEFRSMEKKIEANCRNSVPKHLEQKHDVYSVCWIRIFGKQIFFMPFSSVPSLGIDSHHHQ